MALLPSTMGFRRDSTFLPIIALRIQSKGVSNAVILQDLQQLTKMGVMPARADEGS
ncbi:hypothetical protein [Cupriavidus sp. AcVe19-6a]|uniref:hypothetical protein n=1 Tax=Cupriavidus sp. AcVe19-6a TaxID=2821358 RepID=UPI001AE15914|nr:hypothetical protein [Cupriavidus sp. AcVe19-6a]